MKRYCYAPIPFALLLFSPFIRRQTTKQKNLNVSSSIPWSHHIHKVPPILLLPVLIHPQASLFSLSPTIETKKMQFPLQTKLIRHSTIIVQVPHTKNAFPASGEN
jgi:hypothetical protein